MSSHSLFGPSSLRRRLLCPGSYRFELDAPQPASQKQSPDAARGTFLHSVVADILQNKTPIYPASEHANIRFCVDCVMPIIKETSGKLITEVMLDFATFLPEVGKGTADAIYISEQADLFEFKFGHIQEQSAKENIQLAAYSLGVSRNFKIKNVVAWLIQPATNHVSKYAYNETSLTAIQYMITDIIEKSLTVDAPCFPGKIQCRYCRAASCCPALRHTMVSIPAKWESSALTPNRLGVLLDHAIVAEVFMDAIRDYAIEQLHKGIDIPGWMLGEGRKTRDWKLGALEELKAIARDFKKDENAIVRTDISSPAQLESVWGKSKELKKAMEALIVEVPGKPILRKTT